MQKEEHPIQSRGKAMRACLQYVPSGQSYHEGFTMYPIKCSPSRDGKKIFCTLNIRDEIGNKGVYKKVEDSNDAEADGRFVIDTETGDVEILNLYVSAEMDTYHYDRVKRDVLNDQNKNNGSERKMAVGGKDKKEENLWEINPIKAMMEEAKKESRTPNETMQRFMWKVLDDINETVEKMKDRDRKEMEEIRNKKDSQNNDDSEDGE